MKHRIVTTLTALICIVVGYAGNISVENVSLKPGETMDLKISLSSAVKELCGVQFDVTLPEGFSLVKDNGNKEYKLSSNQTSDMTCEVKDLGSGSFRFILYSGSLQKLKEGELMSLNLMADGNKELGSYSVSLSNVAFSDGDGVVTKESGTSATVKVTNYFNLVYMVDGSEYKSYQIEYGVTITPEAAPTKEGYTFSGWSTIPATMPAKDVTVTGNFTINKYKLTYMVDGVEYKSYQIEYGAKITPEAEPTKEGYSFSGWSSIPETMPAKDVVVTGTFTKGSYKLIYMVDGQVYKTISYDYGATITPEAAPSKEGYTFSGWSSIPATMPAKDVTVTGTFTINKYKLTYMVDGAEYKSYEIEYGAKITPEAEPTKEGYSFSGWSSIPETMPAKDVVVTGTFTKGSYKLTYMVDGEVYKTVSYDYGATITPEAAPTKEGYTFSGWSTIPATMPAKDVTVTGTFTINKYKLTYMVDGAEYKSYEIEYGTKITPEAEPTKEGYSFSGWSSIPETMPAKDVVVTGTFTKGAYKLTYMVDGEVYKTISYDFGSTITPEAEPVKEGYTFSGWSEIPQTMPAKDITVTGTFTINKYKLTYMVDGTEYKSYDVEYGATITPEATPTKEGYTFSGWSEIPQTMPAHDVEVTGEFTGIKYKVEIASTTYGVITTDKETYEKGETVTVTIKDNTGYEMESISTDPTNLGLQRVDDGVFSFVMPDADVMVTVRFKAKEYTLTFMLNNEVYEVGEIPQIYQVRLESWR